MGKECFDEELRLSYIPVTCRSTNDDKSRYEYDVDEYRSAVNLETKYKQPASQTYPQILHKMELETLSHNSDRTTDLLKKLSADLGSDEAKRKTSDSLDLMRGPPEKRPKMVSDNGNGRSSFTRDGRFVYGNPKESIKPPLDVFESNSVLDLSCKGGKCDDIKAKPEGTYHNFYRNNQSYLPDAFPSSNLEIKLVNTPKKPSATEQLQIAKLQQQQRRSVQQQQKMLQQMRRSLETTPGRPPAIADHHKKTPRDERPEPPKEEIHPAIFSHLLPPHPYYDPTPTKELPDGHPILPLLDPVYFSALYNAHGYLPPSSPSIAAAFISTLQDALPKLSMMCPPNQTPASSSLLPQKGNENP